jgi:tRNA(fMet)-specific endonuclease VapC
MYLIDTDILVFMLRGDTRVAENMEARATDPRAMSVITFGELLYGAAKSARPVENAAKVRRLGRLFPVVDVSEDIVETFAPLKAQLERQGEKLDAFDLLIASTALHLGYALVTNNERHFRRIPGLRTENWSH